MIICLEVVIMPDITQNKDLLSAKHFTVRDGHYKSHSYRRRERSSSKIEPCGSPGLTGAQSED